MTIHEAAERLRRYESDPNHRDTYHGTDESVFYDRAILARAMLRELDQTEITEDWLRLIGFKPDDVCNYLFANSHAGSPVDLQWWTVDKLTCFASEDGITELPHITTRGELRTLCRVPKVRLEEL